MSKQLFIPVLWSVISSSRVKILNIIYEVRESQPSPQAPLNDVLVCLAEKLGHVPKALEPELNTGNEGNYII